MPGWGFYWPGCEESERDEDSNLVGSGPAPATGAVSAAPKIAGITELNCNAEAGLKQVRELLSSRGPNAPLASNRGLAAEYAHAASFNADAINKGSVLRAEVLTGGQAADVRVFDTAQPSRTLDKVQFKISERRDYLKQLNRPKYDGMQKVVAEGLQDAARGRSSAMKCGGVSSKSLTVEQADHLAQNPERYFDSLRPNVVSEAAGAAAQGAVVGAALNAGFVLAPALYTRGTVTKDDALQALQAGCDGAMTGAAAGAVATALQSTTAGAIAGGVVATTHAVLAAETPEERMRRAVTGAAGVVAGTGAASLAMTAAGTVGLAASWPLSFTAATAAYVYADRSARRLVEPHSEAVGAAAGKGAEVAGRVLSQGRERVGPLVERGAGAVASAALKGYEGAVAAARIGGEGAVAAARIGGEGAAVAARIGGEGAAVAARKGLEGAVAAAKMARGCAGAVVQGVSEAGGPLAASAVQGVRGLAGGVYLRARRLVGGAKQESSSQQSSMEAQSCCEDTTAPVSRM